MFANFLIYVFVLAVVVLGLSLAFWILKKEAKSEGLTINELLDESIDPTHHVTVKHEVEPEIKKERQSVVQEAQQFSLKRFLQETKVEDFMVHEVHAIKIHADFCQVPKLFQFYNIRHLPVVDESNHLVGMLSQRDLYKICPPRKLLDGEWYYDDEMLNNIILPNVMKPDVEAVQVDAPLGDAIKAMTNHHLGAVPVVNSTGLLKGIITRLDILKLVEKIYSS